MFSKYPCLVILPILLIPCNIVVDPVPNRSSSHSLALLESKGNDFLFLKRGKIFPDNYKPYFEDIHLLDILYSIRDKEEIAAYSLWSVTNYKGKDFIK